MRVVTERGTTTPADTPAVVALGLFDGVHIGHQMVIGVAGRIAADEGLRPAVFTFTHSAKGAALILTPAQKHAALQTLRVDTCYEPPFSQFKDLSPEAFFHDMLLGQFGAKALVCGGNFAFGAKRAGDINLLRRLCAENNVRLEVVSLAEYHGEAVSSSRIRTALAHGRIEDVNAMLGRPYKLDSPVVHGKGLGGTLGMPTINQGFPQGLQLPAFGVYITEAVLDGKAWPSATGWGTRPTVDDGPPSCETFIPGYTGNLYGKTVEVRFYTRMAGIQKFAGVDALAGAVRSWANTAVEYFKKNKPE